MRRWFTAGTVGLLLTFVLAGGIVGGLVRLGGYCGADFLPIEVDLAVEPYVQNVTATAATIMWRTPLESEGAVSFGKTPDLGRTVVSDDARVHTVRLTDLEPNTRYFYRAEIPGIPGDLETFHTSPGPDGTITAAVVGDSGSGNPAQYQVAEVMLAMEPDLVLHTGDVVYPRGGECRYDDRYYDPYRELIGSVPVYPVLGNHDVLTDNGEPYLEAFELPADGSGTERFYSFDFGPMHVAALDSELYYRDDSIPPAVQKAWLVEDLRQTDRPWKVVVIHRPPFNSSPYHGPDPQVLEDLVGIFTAEGVDVVFAAHEHVYERLKPIDGVTYFVTGGGGGRLRSVGTSDLTAVSALRHHALKVEAGPERLVIEAIGIGHEVFDRVELTQPGS